jgi:hypothetical protein
VRWERGNRKPETGNRKPETGNRKPETGNRKPETGNRKPETGNRKYFGPYPIYRFRSPFSGLCSLLFSPVSGLRSPVFVYVAIMNVSVATGVFNVI